MRDPIIYFKLVINIIIAILIALFIIFIVPKLLGFFLPFVIGWIISLIANPLVRFLEKRVKILRKHSSAIIIVSVLVAVIALLYLIINGLVEQTKELLDDLPNLYTSIDGQFTQASKKLQGVYNMMPNNIKAVVDDFRISFNGISTNFIENMNTPSISDASGFAKNIFEGLFLTIITILSAYFFIAERDNLANRINKIIPPSILEKYELVVENFKRAVGGYFKAQFKIMLILLVIMFIGFSILRIRYSFLLALLIAFLDFLPILGQGAVIWPWAIVDLLNGNIINAIGLTVIYLICQIVKQVLQPKMVGDSIGISPLSTLIIMFIGYKFKGILGMILGLPIGMVIISFYQAGLFDGFIIQCKMIIDDINKFRKL